MLHEIIAGIMKGKNLYELYLRVFLHEILNQIISKFFSLMNKNIHDSFPSHYDKQTKE